MKNIQIILILLSSAVLSAPFVSEAKGGGFPDFYNKYKEREDFVSMSIKPGLLRLFVGGDDRDLRQLMKHIKQLKMLIYDTNPDSVRYFSNELNDNFLSGRYDDLLVVKDGGDNVTFKVHMKDKRISELIMLVSDQESLVVLYLQGNIDLGEVKELSKSVNIKGISNLNKLPG